MLVPILIGGGLGAVLALLSRSGGGATTQLPSNVARPSQPGGVSFAEGIASPLWPIKPVGRRHPNHGVVSYQPEEGKTIGNWARRFGATRDDGGRRHAGVDLFGYHNDVVVAMAPGTVIATQSFHLGSHALFIDHGPYVVMYGEIGARSWQEFGVKVGDRVGAGAPIGRIACMVFKEGRCTSHMLHLETYRKGTSRNKRWLPGKPPAELLNPTMMLLLAAQRA